jgi:hypothetical protein
MRSLRRRVAQPCRSHEPRRDLGAVDVSIQMLFGLMAVIFVMLLIFEVTAFWHTRNVLDEAAAEGARVAAAYDGTCVDGVAAARASLRAVGGAWTSNVRISCVDGPMVTVSITGSTPGALGRVGFKTSVSESAPKER